MDISEGEVQDEITTYSQVYQDDEEEDWDFGHGIK